MGKLGSDPLVIIEALQVAASTFDQEQCLFPSNDHYRDIVKVLIQKLQETSLQKLQSQEVIEALDSLFSKYDFVKFWPPTMDLSVFEKLVESRPVQLRHLTLQMLAGHYLPLNQIEKVTEILRKAPELTKNFWEICLFNGPAEFPRAIWNGVTKQSLSYLNSSDCIQNFLPDLYRLGQSDLVRLWTDNGLKIPKELVPDLFGLAISTKDSELLTPLLQQHGDFRYPDGSTYMHRVVEENEVTFIDFLIQNKMPSNESDFNGDTPFQLAFNGKSLSVALLLGNEVLEKFADRALKLDNVQLKDHLFEIFLNSYSQDVQKLLNVMEIRNNQTNEKLKIIQEMRQYLKTKGTLFARPPSFRQQREMHDNYGKQFPNYCTQQKAFAEKRYACCQHVSEKINSEKWSLERAYRALAAGREDLKFSEWRIGVERNFAYTPLEGDDVLDKYRPFEKLMIQSFKSNLPKSRSVEAAVSLYQAAFQLKYKAKNKLKNAAMLVLCRPEDSTPGPSKAIKTAWVHLGGSEVDENFAEVSNIFNEILNMPSEKGHSVPSANLKEAMKTFYWLACHAMPTYRGNSQYALELHRILYAHHGFHTAPLSQKFVYPDCVALSTALEEFKDKYYDQIFENSPQPL